MNTKQTQHKILLPDTTLNKFPEKHGINMNAVKERIGETGYARLWQA